MPSRQVVDWNNDGKKDLLIGSDSINAVYLNQGTDAAPSFLHQYPLVDASQSGPNSLAYVDWNGDGVNDLISAGGAPGITALSEHRDQRGSEF
jgi:hypothetical protein